MLWRQGEHGLGPAAVKGDRAKIMNYTCVILPGLWRGFT